MNKILTLRQQIKEFYAQRDSYLGPIIKAIVMLVILLVINTQIGYSDTLLQWNIIAIAVLAAALLPWGAMTFIAALFTIIHLFALSWEIAVIVGIFFFIAAIMQYVFLPGFGLAIVLIPVFYYLHIPFVVPLVLGLVGGMTTFIPSMVGAFLYYFFVGIQANADYFMRTSGSSASMMDRFPQILSIIKGNDLMLISIIAFGLITLVVYIIRRRSIDYASYIALAVGTILNIVIFLIGSFTGNVVMSYLEVFLGSVIAFVIASGVELWLTATDYDHTEYLQYEDDDYVYYVKAVPKIRITGEEVKVKEITSEEPEYVINITDDNYDTDKKIQLENFRKE